MAREIIHYTGYEVPFDRIVVADPKDKTLGHLIGTADMIGQMADRCYLEKCRDRLYPEFVLGGMALPISSNGGRQVRYASGLDVLRQTPEFVAETRSKRLDGAFGGAYRHIEALFGGQNPYMDMIERNVGYLNRVLRSENWRLLRRNPPVFSALADPMATVRGSDGRLHPQRLVATPLIRTRCARRVRRPPCPTLPAASERLSVQDDGFTLLLACPDAQVRS